jgi:RNA polymerase sigma-70 factor (ECF subfamily)
VKGLEVDATQELDLDLSGIQATDLLPAAPLPLDGVYRAHAGAVARWVHRLGGPGIDVEDCVHEVFLVVQARLAQFRGEAKISTWLYRITHNVIRNQRRKLRFRRWLSGSARETAGEVAEPGPSPAEALEVAQRRTELYAVLDQLPERQRTAFILFELEQLPGVQVAELMDAKLETVWVWLHRARAHFRKLAAANPEVAP